PPRSSRRPGARPSVDPSSIRPMVRRGGGEKGYVGGPAGFSERGGPRPFGGPGGGGVCVRGPGGGWGGAAPPGRPAAARGGAPPPSAAAAAAAAPVEAPVQMVAPNVTPPVAVAPSASVVPSASASAGAVGAVTDVPTVSPSSLPLAPPRKAAGRAVRP